MIDLTIVTMIKQTNSDNDEVIAAIMITIITIIAIM